MVDTIHTYVSWYSIVRDYPVARALELFWQRGRNLGRTISLDGHLEYCHLETACALLVCRFCVPYYS